MVTDPSPGFKHAFVTGATGIVGAPLCNKLAEMGVRVTAYSRTAGSFDLLPGVDHAQGDILDPVVLADAANGADVIFHVAAAVHGSESTFDGFESVNVTGTGNVIRIARDSGVRLVHVSTVNVEGFHQGVLTDDYSSTKARAEELVLDAVENGLDALIVRPAMVFGSEAGRAGLIVDRLLSGSLKVLPAPSRKISPVWAGDLAVALIRAAESGKTGETYTVAGPTMSTREFVGSVSTAAGVPKPRMTITVWAIVVPLQLAWWSRRFTRWTPAVSVESVRSDSIHDGNTAASELGFSYTPISEIFDGGQAR
ncbi:MAG: NAD-dependent epimerase/dehydratase family protein [Chloroflexi bacterium]|nr:NAD-dependent epimerase/dehydratase family protein [Chloroflexota bacterium]